MRRVPEAEQHSGFTLPSSALTGVYTCLSSVWWLLIPSICMRTKTAQVEHHSGQVRQMQPFLESHHLSRRNSRTKGPSGRLKLGKLLLDSAAPSTFAPAHCNEIREVLGTEGRFYLLLLIPQTSEWNKNQIVHLQWVPSLWTVISKY